jgi:ABC-type branched-subunit amino acid transport system substrate-binding protein
VETTVQRTDATSTHVDLTNATIPELVEHVLASTRKTALLLLVGYPEPAATIVRAVRTEPHLTGILIGDPAGRAESTGWSRLLGQDGTGVPYLRYLPETLGHAAAGVASRVEQRLQEPPSFVALEGYDTVQVVAAGLRLAGDDRAGLSRALPRIEVAGTRGLIRFSREAGVPTLQWVWPPVQAAARLALGEPATVLEQRAVVGGASSRR